MRRAVHTFTVGDGSPGVPAPATGSRGVAERPAELEQLRAAGLVTPAEYADKR